MRHDIHEPSQAVEQLQRLPGGPELLALAHRRGDIALVGGAVRDLLLGHWPRELDVTVATGSAELAKELAASISPSERPYGHAVEPVLHERFGTASVIWDYGRIDIAELRAESYDAPGALPAVRTASVEQDLQRRDFTVNAISLALTADRPRLLQADGALEDLKAGTLRVLHERSFVDDPTRLLRLARYAARLGFEIEPQTHELASQALAGGALGTVSGARVAAELWLAAREQNADGAFRALDSLGVLAAVGMPSPFDDRLSAEAVALLPHEGSREMLVMGIALRRAQTAAAEGDHSPHEQELPEQLAFTREQTAAVQAVAAAEGLARLAFEASPAAVQAALDEHSLEAAALSAVLAGRRSPQAAMAVNEWLQRLRHVRLEIDGNDLVEAGVPQGPEVGLRLRRALASKREGAVSGREQELQAALNDEMQAADAARSRGAGR